MNTHATLTSINTSNDSSNGTSTNQKNEKEPFKVRAELFAPTRLAPSAYAVYRTRALVIDVLAHECMLLVLLAAKTLLRVQPTGDMAAALQLPRVGILGGGHVGSAVALALLTHGYPSELLAVSTRQPERVPKCTALQSQQAQTLYQSVPKFYDNARLGRESDVLVLCTSPSQLKSVAIQIKHALSVSDAPTLVVSALCGVPLEQLQKVCGGSDRAKLVVRAKVHVAALTRGSEISASGAAIHDLDLARASGSSGATTNSSITNNIDRRQHRLTAAVALAAQELAREHHDVEQLVQVLTELGLRAATAGMSVSTSRSSNSVDHDATDAFERTGLHERATRELLGCAHDNHSRGRGTPPPAATTACWRADWDDVLTQVQHAVAAARAVPSSSSSSADAIADARGSVCSSRSSAT